MYSFTFGCYSVYTYFVLCRHQYLRASGIVRFASLASRTGLPRSLRRQTAYELHKCVQHFFPLFFLFFITPIFFVRFDFVLFLFFYILFFSLLHSSTELIQYSFFLYFYRKNKQKERKEPEINILTDTDISRQIILIFKGKRTSAARTKWDWHWTPRTIYIMGKSDAWENEEEQKKHALPVSARRQWSPKWTRGKDRSEQGRNGTSNV